MSKSSKILLADLLAFIGFLIYISWLVEIDFEAGMGFGLLVTGIALTFKFITEED